MRLYTGHVLLSVGDLPRALDFYTRVLGLALKVHLAGDWAEVAAPGLTIALKPGRAASSTPQPQGVAVGLHVRDLDAARAELEAHGVTLSADKRSPLSRRADFADPDGHPLYLLEYVRG